MQLSMFSRDGVSEKPPGNASFSLISFTFPTTPGSTAVPHGLSRLVAEGTACPVWLVPLGKDPWKPAPGLPQTARSLCWDTATSPKESQNLGRSWRPPTPSPGARHPGPAADQLRFLTATLLLRLGPRPRPHTGTHRVLRAAPHPARSVPRTDRGAAQWPRRCVSCMRPLLVTREMKPHAQQQQSRWPGRGRHPRDRRLLAGNTVPPPGGWRLSKTRRGVPRRAAPGTALQTKGQSHRRPRAEWVQPYEMLTTSKAIEVGIRLVAAGGWGGE